MTPSPRPQWLLCGGLLPALATSWGRALSWSFSLSPVAPHSLPSLPPNPQKPTAKPQWTVALCLPHLFSVYFFILLYTLGNARNFPFLIWICSRERCGNAGSPENPVFKTMACFFPFSWCWMSGTKGVRLGMESDPKQPQQG